VPRKCYQKPAIDLTLNINVTFSQRAHQGAEVVGLFKLAFADLNNVGEVFPNGAQQFLTGRAFARIKAIKRVLIIRYLHLQRAEDLRTSC
jgi:hypothetical protein